MLHLSILEQSKSVRSALRSPLMIILSIEFFMLFSRVVVIREASGIYSGDAC